MSGYKYVLDKDLVMNGSEISDNSCYNPYPDPNQPMISGLLNISACKFNAPAYVSYPLFYQGDQYLIDQFDGETFHPNEKDHESYLILEPRSGVPLEVRVRLQINVLARELSKVTKGSDIVNIT